MKADIKKPKLRREQLAPGEVLCAHCTAKCCRYFALPIELPETFAEWEYIRWYLLHSRATVFVDEGDWYLMVHTTCKHLQPNYMCGIYETRPQICRDYSTKDCEYEDDWVYDQYFETPEQIVEYAEAVLPRSGNSNGRSAKPPLLPILSRTD